MHDSLTLPAPAKINRLLHITGRRPDGYHRLQTLFQFLELADQLRFTPNDQGLIALETALPGVPDEDNLVLKAARLLAPLRANSQLGCTIQLQKNLPMGGGLGAGSSDAATTLLALNHLWQLNLPREQLIHLALTLGADVPVFIFGESAWAEGVGEELSHCPLDEGTLLLIHPGCHCNTGQLFSHADLPRNTPAITATQALAQLGSNDFEALVRQLYPPVQAVFDWLKAADCPAFLTGSGACIYTLMPDPHSAEALLQQLPSQLAGSPIRGWLTQRCNLSPAHRALQVQINSKVHI
ncbi:4-(cytidine 5'-diphospho)-2-C-methyl-D-erythritol kinase [Marinospirillum alkaliphilum]|uniref:4-diphosphocytidyl-2-C-methyl-D-erythritol kinase n=1 Tax=Marinospirillum alkaliphilum DSM 21637 TaxID=1122209 RepID=A0A1K1YXK1_9GAMM|nr:4-(cytidine 5'-diphospho)-2-C-methyl-D-erythritol kinase [Marinospirillum alkaliphilum]SFX66646.1 4-diphosphocytidyl-2-C-methyl-D-erythritol kinase [Marinospirillum alkaliphilum DSM 21637]